MPFLSVTTNANCDENEEREALKQLSKALAEALGKPEDYVMVQLLLKTPMCFQGSTEVCAAAHVESIGKIDAQTNGKTASMITKCITEVLGVPSGRIYVTFADVPATNWAMNGNTFG